MIRTRNFAHRRNDASVFHGTVVDYLARMETRVALECLLSRVTNAKLVTDNDRRIYGQPFRSPTALPVTFDPIR